MFRGYETVSSRSLPERVGLAPYADGARARADDPGTQGQPANALTSRPYRFLWLDNVTFFLVANAQRFVFGWSALDGLQRGEGQQGLVVFTLGLPAAFLVLQAGVWADRYDRRRMLLITQTFGASVMVATALLVASDRIDLGSVLVLTLLAGSAAAIGSPVRASLIPALVAREQLAWRRSLHSSW
jgi:MFS family permease